MCVYTRASAFQVALSQKIPHRYRLSQLKNIIPGNVSRFTVRFVLASEASAQFSNSSLGLFSVRFYLPHTDKLKTEGFLEGKIYYRSPGWFFHRAWRVRLDQTRHTSSIETAHQRARLRSFPILSLTVILWLLHVFFLQCSAFFTAISETSPPNGRPWSKARIFFSFKIWFGKNIPTDTSRVVHIRPGKPKPGETPRQPGASSTILKEKELWSFLADWVHS